MTCRFGVTTFSVHTQTELQNRGLSTEKAQPPRNSVKFFSLGSKFPTNRDYLVFSWSILHVVHKRVLWMTNSILVWVINSLD